MARKRNTGTEAKIKAAFTQLLKEKGFDAMTVSDIARIAGINRGTFYMHYMDKYDLRQQLLDNAIFDLRRILTSNVGAPVPLPAPGQHASVLDVIAPQATLQALLYIRADAAFFDAISQSGQNLKMYNDTKETLKHVLEERAKALGIHPSLGSIPPEYSGEIVVSGVTSIIWMWVKRGFKESPEEITKYIEISKRLSPMALMR